MSNHIDTNQVFIVVPAFNEDAIIRQVIIELCNFNYQVIVVDDGSATPVVSLLKDLPVHILRHKINLGQGAALQTGMEFALSLNAQYAVTFDADGQHQASDIEGLLAPLVNNEADITIGSRFMKGSKHNMTRGRKITIKTARLINYIFTGLMLTDAYNGLRALNRTSLTEIKINENGTAHATELLSIIRTSKLRYKEIPVNIRYTEYSRKKGLTVWNGFRIFFDILLNKIFK